MSSVAVGTDRVTSASARIAWSMRLPGASLFSITIRPGARSARGVTDAADGTAFGTTTCTGERPNLSSTSSRCAAVGHRTASNRSARVNHLDQSEFSGASGVYGGSRWIVWIACRSRSAGSSQPARSSPSCRDSQTTTIGRSGAPARRPSTTCSSHARYSAPNPSTIPATAPRASYTATGAVVMCQSGSPVITGRPTTGLPAASGTERYSSAGSGSPGSAAARSHAAAPPCGSAVSSKRLRIRAASITRSRPANVARCRACSAGVPGSSVRSRGPSPSCTPPAAICLARASVARA